MDTFLKELLASLVGMMSAFILGSKIRLYFEIRKSLKINLLGLVQGASYYIDIYLHLALIFIFLPISHYCIKILLSPLL